MIAAGITRRPPQVSQGSASRAKTRLRVGCGLRLHVQDGRIVTATSGLDNAITLGNRCIKGRFGWHFVHSDPAGD